MWNPYSDPELNSSFLDHDFKFLEVKRMLVTPGHVKLSVPRPLSLQCCHHLSPAFLGLLVPHS